MQLKSLLTSMLILLASSSFAQNWAPAGNNIKTKWAEQLTPENVWQEYPRPQMVREDWQCLNGLWDYAVSSADAASMPAPEGQILVPFAIESSLSGVCRRITEDNALWYHRAFSIPKKWKNDRILLHFDAVDWKCEIWVNGQNAGVHSGGYTAFAIDITPYLVKGAQEVTVKVQDGTNNRLQPRGKQVNKPSGIWYTPVSGIWQSVWMEPVNAKGSISDYKINTDIDAGTITVNPVCDGVQAGDQIRVTVSFAGKKVASEKAAAGGPVTLKIKEPQLWTPDQPNLYDFEVELFRGPRSLDKVSGYTAMRSISVMRDALGNKRMALNGKILFQYGPLDQGWWPDGLYTAPCDEALRYDIEMTKKYGFNMIRKHIKVEPSRWYMWCDKLGILVWQDMPSISSCYKGVWSQNVKDEKGRNYYNSGKDSELSDEAKATYRKEWKEIIGQLDKFQCIVVWVPFNEGWAQFDTGKIVDLTRSLDNTRLINGASGGNWVKGEMGDILDSHYYPQPKMRIIDPELVNVLGEYGGIGLPLEGHTWDINKKWGYIQYKTSEEVTKQYVDYTRDLLKIAAEGCAAAVYTQTTDVEGEVNGLMTYDRKVNKLDIESLNKANSAVIEAGSKLALISSENFLKGTDNPDYKLITIKGGDLIMQVTNFGGRVISLWTPDKNGNYADVVIGYNTLDQYINNKGERFLGSSPGPVANRIGGAQFKLNGKTIKVSANDGANTLHGGFKGIDMLTWKVVEVSDNSVTFEVVHPDGLDGFPGNKTIRMTYTLTDNNEFKVDFEATTDQDTPINLAHHSFFNLRGCGNGTILDHVLTINASANTPVNKELIPTGKIKPLAGTPRDFRQPTVIGKRIDKYRDKQMAFGHGYDHNYVLDRRTKDGMDLAATVYEPESGRYMEVLTDQPGLQFYSGYFFDGSVNDKYDKPMVRNCSFALETQKFPDAVNHSNFPDIILKAGDTYKHSCIYKLSTR